MANAFGWERISTGDLLRAARDAGTQLGHQAEQYMSKGALVPDDVIVSMVREKLATLGPGRAAVIHLAATIDVAGGSGAGSKVTAASPIHLIVATAVSRASEVGNFIVVIAGCG